MTQSFDQITSTLEYYRTNAESFAAGTKDVDVASLYAPFLRELPDGASILDAGCGSGRDTKFFSGRGYKVTAFDYSPEMVAIAEQHSGQTVQQLSFYDVDFNEEFDAVWACASMLHVPKADMSEILAKLKQALKSGGVLYTSFKYGTDEVVRGGRHFSNFNEDTLRRLVKHVGGLEVRSEWVTSDLRPGREDEKWLNVILRKEMSRDS